MWAYLHIQCYFESKDNVMNNTTVPSRFKYNELSSGACLSFCFVFFLWRYSAIHRILYNFFRLLRIFLLFQVNCLLSSAIHKTLVCIFILILIFQSGNLVYPFIPHSLFELTFKLLWYHIHKTQISDSRLRIHAFIKAEV